MAFENILVVCVGNICRSPIAEALLSAQYPHKNIYSAGLSAVVGNPVDPLSQQVMTPYKLDMSAHIAKQIDEELVSRADIILTMSTNQTKWIIERWPHCRGKTFRIGHWLDKDIADPYQQQKSAFESAREDIVASVASWTDKIN